MRAARVTLYHVNAWGVAEDQQRLSGYSAYFKGVQRPNQVEMGNLALQALAYQSGGRTFDANNDTAGEIATCVAEATSFYTLTFDSIAGGGPNEYHSLEVKLDKPGLTARTRTGYYAQPEPARPH